MAQHDYNIANGGGAAVRADINNALTAIQSLNSGSTAPTSTVAGMLWYDTAAGALKQRNAANTAWVAAAELIAGGGQLAGLRNKIINGQFNIWQRGTSGATATGGFGYVSADRWYGNCVSGITCAINRNTTIVGSESTYGKYYLGAAFTGTGVSGSNVGQRIEGVEQFSGQTVTVSFYAADTVATSLTVILRQNFGTGGSPSTSVDTSSSAITITSGFGTRYTVTLALPSISGKTLGTNNDSYLDVIFVPSAANAHTFSLGAVQLEVGGVATPFEQRPIGLELALCQRYAWLVGNTGASSVPFMGFQVGTTLLDFQVSLPMVMRSAPTVSTSGWAWNATGPTGNQVGSYDPTASGWLSSTHGTIVSSWMGASDTRNGFLRLTGSGGAFGGASGRVAQLNLGSTAWFLFSSEL